MKKEKLIGLPIMIGLVLIDLLTKSVVESKIALLEQVEVIPNFFWLTNVRNTGAAWSLFDGKVGILSIISLVATVALLIYYFSDEHSKWTFIALILMIAGTVGNFIDRLFLQYVRDFLSFNIFGYMFPVFNLADALLVIGVFILCVEVIFNERNHH